jgi:hypothetical protein
MSSSKRGLLNGKLGAPPSRISAPQPAGKRSEEALTHIHTILVMILRDYIAKGRDIPADTYDSNAITIEVE